MPLDGPAITVGELNRKARALLEQAFPLLWITGEISNLTRASSGHWYFSLKDDKAQVRCVMFRHKNQHLDFIPANGLQVEARGLVSLYEPRGDFQVTVETMRRSGLGALFEAFEKLKLKLDREGLFAAARKRPLPTFPRQVGIVTSPAGAVVHDVLTTLRRRWPGLPVVIYPTPVQGEGAAQKIAEAVETAGRRQECDVLILARGGGSIEDLWPFNEEIVARALFHCAIPIVSGVGHETDFTIADFVADQRAPTPTAAAEMVSPNRAALAPRVASLSERLRRLGARAVETRMQHLDHLLRRLVHPGHHLASQAAHLAHLGQRLKSAFHRRLDERRFQADRLEGRLARRRPDVMALGQPVGNLRHRLHGALAQRLEMHAAVLGRLEANLDHLNPHGVLDRGYAIVQTQDGHIIRDTQQVRIGDGLEIMLARGAMKARVTQTDHGDPTPV